MTNPASPGRFVGEGKYELLSPIGLGAMGVVYLARHVALDRVVAVKLLNAGLTANADAAERFLREARAASLLRHKNTVHVLDFGGDQQAGFFLVMEYIEGKNLSEVLAEEGTLAPGRAILIVSQVLAALAEAHEFEIVHRDIKPANIMLVPWTDDDGRDIEHVKVLDFGLATMRSEPHGHIRDEIAGTPEYMSPEQTQGSDLDARSDIYAVATTLYAMVCGEVPFAFDSALETMVAQVSSEPRKPSTLAPHLSPELEAVILRGLAKARDDRFDNARAFRTALLETPEMAGSGPTLASTLSSPRPGTSGTEPLITPLPVELPVAPPGARARGPMWLALAILLVGAAVLVAWQVGAFEEAGAPASVAQREPTPAPSQTKAPEPAKTEPVAVTPGPTVAAPPKPEPMKTEPVALVPVKLEPMNPEPAKTEPVKTEPVALVPEPVAVAVIEPPKKDTSDGKKPKHAVEPEATKTEPAKPAPTPEPIEVDEVAQVDTVAPTPTPKIEPKVEPEVVPKPEPKRAPALAAQASVTNLVVDGSLPRSSIARAIDGMTAALEACYQAAARSANADAATSANVHFVIDVDGRTRNVAVGPLSLPGLQACATSTFARLRTKDRPDTGTVGAALHLSFTPRVP